MIRPPWLAQEDWKSTEGTKGLWILSEAQLWWSFLFWGPGINLMRYYRVVRRKQEVTIRSTKLSSEGVCPLHQPYIYATRSTRTTSGKTKESVDQDAWVSRASKGEKHKSAETQWRKAYSQVSVKESTYFFLNNKGINIWLHLGMKMNGKNPVLTLPFSTFVPSVSIFAGSCFRIYGNRRGDF